MSLGAGVEVRGGPAQREGETVGAGLEGRLGKASCEHVIVASRCAEEWAVQGEAGRHSRQREQRRGDGKPLLALSSPVSLHSFQQRLFEGLLCARHGSALGGSSSLSDFASTGVRGRGGLSLILGTAYPGEKA